MVGETFVVTPPASSSIPVVRNESSLLPLVYACESPGFSTTSDVLDVDDPTVAYVDHLKDSTPPRGDPKRHHRLVTLTRLNLDGGRCARRGRLQLVPLTLENHTVLLGAVSIGPSFPEEPAGRAPRQCTSSSRTAANPLSSPTDSFA